MPPDRHVWWVGEMEVRSSCEGSKKQPYYKAKEIVGKKRRKLVKNWHTVMERKHVYKGGRLQMEE